MRDYFYTLAERLGARLRASEVLLLALAGEESDFVRFNRSRVRQAGRVHQASLDLDLIQGRRHATLEYELQQDLDTDLPVLGGLLRDLRDQLPHLPEDPHLLYATEVRSTEHLDPRPVPDARAITAQVCDAAAGLDLVGLLAAGRIFHGFANSLGQRNWHEGASFNLDWSCHLAADKAVKAGYAGVEWSQNELLGRMERVRGEMEVMGRPPVSLAPGVYRVFLAPAALRELLSLLGREGFGLKAHHSAETPLLRMVREGRRLGTQITLLEHAAAGIAPRFTPEGFICPAQVELIRNGVYRDCLVGPRSSRELGVPVTGSEQPHSLDLLPGDLPLDQMPVALGQGLWINNLWYCNFSDLRDCRITGMTRFACLWVEGGEIRAPVSVMRFDDSLYRLLGDHLEGLTRERELILDSETYGGRSTDSFHLPGALVGEMRLTL
jgi:predicted Zn-dependent protease